MTADFGIREMTVFPDEEGTGLTGCGERMARRCIKGIRICGGRFAVSFKAGIDPDIKR